MDADAVECVYSSEEQVTEMLPLSKEQEESPGDFGVVDNFRYRSKQLQVQEQATITRAIMTSKTHSKVRC